MGGGGQWGPATVLQNIFCVQQKKEIDTRLELHYYFFFKSTTYNTAVIALFWSTLVEESRVSRIANVMKFHLKFENHCCWCCLTEQGPNFNYPPQRRGSTNRNSFVPDISLFCIHSPISLPASVAAVSGGTGVGNCGGWCSATSWSIWHGHLSALISVADLSTIAVCTRWRFCSPHSFKVFRIALKPWTFTARSRSILLWFRFTVEAVASAKRKFNACCRFTNFNLC